jgi:hypothetical protein
MLLFACLFCSFGRFISRPCFCCISLSPSFTHLVKKSDHSHRYRRNHLFENPWKRTFSDYLRDNNALKVSYAWKLADPHSPTAWLWLWRRFCWMPRMWATVVLSDSDYGGGYVVWICSLSVSWSQDMYRYLLSSRIGALEKVDPQSRIESAGRLLLSHSTCSSLWVFWSNQGVRYFWRLTGLVASRLGGLFGAEVHGWMDWTRILGSCGDDFDHFDCSNSASHAPEEDRQGWEFRGERWW